MKEYKNIDELFKSNLTDYKVAPDPKRWSKINSDLGRKNSIYYRGLLFMAALLLFTSGGYWYLENVMLKDQSSEQHIVNADNISNQNINPNIASQYTYNQKVEENNIIINNETKQTDYDHESDFIVVNNEEDSNIGAGSTKRIDNEYITNLDAKSSPIEQTNEYVENKKYISLGRLSGKFENNILDNENPLVLKNHQTMDINQYIEKKKKFHLFTGISAFAGMVYYNDSPDMFTWSTDLAIGYKIKKFYIESGIGYQDIKKHGEYRIDYETNDSVGSYQEVVSFELNPLDHNEIYYNTKTTTVYDSVLHYAYQSPVYQYNYINIPIKVGYNFFDTKKIRLSAETGIIYGILTKTIIPQVKYSTPESTLVNIQNNTPNRSQTNFRIHISLRASYNIHRSLSFSIQPEFSKYLNSIYDDENNTQYPYTMGVRAGLYFNF